MERGGKAPAYAANARTNPTASWTRSDWQDTIDLLEEYVNLPKGAVTPDKVFTNAFLPR